MAGSATASSQVSGRLTARRKSGRAARTDGYDDSSHKQVRAHRRRQASVAALLDQTFGQWAQCDPDLWERRAYLMLVGLVYERLATNEKELPNEELIALAKILAENRRAEARLHDNHRPREAAAPPDARSDNLPVRFGDIVRQIYGTNLVATDGQEDSQANG